MTEALIIIDMQKGFWSAKRCKRTINACVNQIHRARRLSMPIYIVEFRGYQDTIQPLLDAVEGYDKFSFVFKEYNDGSQELANMFAQDSFKPSKMYICGVNIEACVLNTVEGLMDIFPCAEYHVIKPACNTEMHRSKAEALEWFPYRNCDAVRVLSRQPV